MIEPELERLDHHFILQRGFSVHLLYPRLLWRSSTEAPPEYHFSHIIGESFSDFYEFFKLCLCGLHLNVAWKTCIVSVSYCQSVENTEHSYIHGVTETLNAWCENTCKCFMGRLLFNFEEKTDNLSLKSLNGFYCYDRFSGKPNANWAFVSSSLDLTEQIFLSKEELRCSSIDSTTWKCVVCAVNMCCVLQISQLSFVAKSSDTFRVPTESGEVWKWSFFSLEVWKKKSFLVC